MPKTIWDEIQLEQRDARWRDELERLAARERVMLAKLDEEATERELSQLDDDLAQFAQTLRKYHILPESWQRSLTERQ